MNNHLDTRILQLAKWKIPKSENTIFYNSDDTYLSIGYFDMLDIKEAEDSLNCPPLLNAYSCLHRSRSLSSSDSTFLFEHYSLQEMILFTNIGEEDFTKNEIDDFWNEKSLLMFVSLIHIDNKSNIPDILERLKETFHKNHYLYYFSFDYSGIILLAKGLNMRDYLIKMFSLNYQSKNNQKLIRDSYSLCGFHKGMLHDFFEQFQNKPFEDIDIDDTENLSIAVNIGIQNYNTYIEFLNELKKYRNVDLDEFGLLGRHDVSIVNQKASMKWIVYLQYLLNKYTQHSDTRKDDHLFSTHETFIKINLKNSSFTDVSSSNENEFYDIAKKQLFKLQTAFFQTLDKDPTKYSGEYKVPIQEVVYSILSIMKNQFAEDFVLCMYQSFCDFLKYLISQMSCPDLLTAEDYNKNLEQFNQCFENYFSGLNSLVNSTMHSERQFIQVTAFNAIIYDIPSKIMAFYVAIIDRMQKLIKSSSDKNYTFLLVPSFHNEISVKIISYFPGRNESPQDRILMVTINEKSLYNPKIVIQRMAHEIAHFVGDELRCRRERKLFIKLTIIDLLLNHVLHPAFIKNEKYNELNKTIYLSLPDNNKFSNEINHYSNYLKRALPIYIAREFIENEKIQVALKDYIRHVLQQYFSNIQKDEADNLSYGSKLRDYLNYLIFMKFGNLNNPFHPLSLENFTFNSIEIDILVRFIIEDINTELIYICRNTENFPYIHSTDQSAISKVGTNLLKGLTLQEFGERFIPAYSEAFADLQMIFLMNIRYEDYLQSFLKIENLDLSTLEESIADLARIAMIVYVLNYIGFWDIIEESNKFTEDLLEFHNIITDQFYGLDNMIPPDFFDESDREVISLLSDNPNSAQNHTDSFHTSNEYITLNPNSFIYMFLINYLAECAKQSFLHYKGNSSDIREFRKTIFNMIQFDNISDVFCSICKELEFYKTSLFEDNEFK